MVIITLHAECSMQVIAAGKEEMVMKEGKAHLSDYLVKSSRVATAASSWYEKDRPGTSSSGGSSPSADCFGIPRDIKHKIIIIMIFHLIAINRPCNEFIPYLGPHIPHLLPLPPPSIDPKINMQHRGPIWTPLLHIQRLSYFWDRKGSPSLEMLQEEKKKNQRKIQWWGCCRLHKRSLVQVTN